jgi:hypothetical protein
MGKIDVSNIKTAVAISQKANVPLYLWGGVGISKTQQIYQYATSTNQKCAVVTGLAIDPTDVVGHYIADFNKRITYQSKPYLYELFGEEERGIIFLDEFNNSESDIMGVFLKLLDEKRLGSYKLPDGIHIIAAGNPPELAPNASSLPLAVATRFAHLYVEADFISLKRWLKGAEDEEDYVKIFNLDVGEDVVQQVFDIFVDYCIENGLSPASEDSRSCEWEGILNYRTLHYAAKIGAVYKVAYKNVSNQSTLHNVTVETIHGLVGTIASNLMEHLANKWLPSAKEILENYDIVLKHRDAYAALAYNLMSGMQEKDYPRLVDFMQWLEKKNELVMLAAIVESFQSFIPKKRFLTSRLEYYNQIFKTINRSLDVYKKIKPANNK